MPISPCCLFCDKPCIKVTTSYRECDLSSGGADLPMPQAGVTPLHLLQTYDECLLNLPACEWLHVQRE